MSMALTPDSTNGAKPLGAGLMRQGREDDIDALGYVFGYRQIDRREMRKDIAQPLSDGAPTGDGGYLGFGVSRQDTRKLDARVSRDVDYAYFHLNPLGRTRPWRKYTFLAVGGSRRRGRV